MTELVPVPKTRKEATVLNILREEYRKADGVARAGAIFEAEVHEQLLQENVAAGVPIDEAGDIPKVFIPDQLNESFRRLLQFRIELRLMRLLKLGEHEKDLAKHLLDQAFAKPKKSTKPARTYVGTPDNRQIYDLKQE